MTVVAHRFCWLNKRWKRVLMETVEASTHAVPCRSATDSMVHLLVFDFDEMRGICVDKQIIYESRWVGRKVWRLCCGAGSESEQDQQVPRDDEAQTSSCPK
jgi:hypothetical protein